MDQAQAIHRLRFGVCMGRPGDIDAALASGLHIDAVLDAQGRTALQIAASGQNRIGDNLIAFGHLIERGADVNVVGTDPRPPAWIAVAEFQDERFLEYALRAGAHVHWRNDDGRTLLHAAAQVGSRACTRLLLDAGADPNAQDTRLNTPLHIVANRDMHSLCPLLVLAGADPNLSNKQDQRPIDVAKRSLAVDTLELLWALGAQADQAPVSSTRLDCAIRTRDPQVVAWCLQHCPDVVEQVRQALPTAQATHHPLEPLLRSWLARRDAHEALALAQGDLQP